MKYPVFVKKNRSKGTQRNWRGPEGTMSRWSEVQRNISYKNRFRDSSMFVLVKKK